MIKVIAEHSVDVDLLTTGICIDVGCRGFAFSEAMRDLGCEVHAFDLEPMDTPIGVLFIQAAVIADNRKAVTYVNTKDQQAKYVSDSGTEYVASVYLQRLLQAMTYERKTVDILKLDCEGQEYALLSDPNFQPIPRQISVEFHMHAHRAPHNQYYDKCMENLLKYYLPVKHELTRAHGAGENYWDSLFIRKDLI